MTRMLCWESGQQAEELLAGRGLPRVVWGLLEILGGGAAVYNPFNLRRIWYLPITIAISG